MFSCSEMKNSPVRWSISESNSGRRRFASFIDRHDCLLPKLNRPTWWVIFIFAASNECAPEWAEIINSPGTCNHPNCQPENEASEFSIFYNKGNSKYQSGYWSQSKRSVCHMAAPNLPELRIFSSKSPWASEPNKVVVFHCDLGCFSYLLHLHKALNPATSSTRSWSLDSTICVVGLLFYCILSINNWCWN